MRQTSLLVSVAASLLLNTGCGLSCTRLHDFGIAFSRPISSNYSVMMTIGGKSYAFPCPGYGSLDGDGSQFQCTKTGVRLQLPDVDIKSTSPASITIATPDGSLLTQVMEIQFAGPWNPNPENTPDDCERLATLQLSDPFDASAL
jgi:hypothetical protein